MEWFEERTRKTAVAAVDRILEEILSAAGVAGTEEGDKSVGFEQFATVSTPLCGQNTHDPTRPPTSTFSPESDGHVEERGYPRILKKELDSFRISTT